MEDKFAYGFDAAKEVYCDMVKSGIVDPTKVSRSALQNANSIAGTFLTTESAVSISKEPEAPNPGAGAGMGMM